MQPAPDTHAPPRLLGLVPGDPANPLTLSGVPRFLLNALGRRCTVVGTLDYGLSGTTRLGVGALTARRTRAAWRARFHTSPVAHRALSLTLTHRLRKSPGPYDLAFQVFGWVGGQPRPYVIYVDQTRLMAEAGWPIWMPLLSRERAGVLAREELMYQGATHLFTMGQDARRSLVHAYGVDPDRVTVVGGGVNFDTLPDPAPRGRQRSVLFVGRDFERKGGDTLVHAFRIVRRALPDAELHMVGATIACADPGVIVHGRLTSRDQVADLYRQATVFCGPSRYEPWGLAFAEAMAYGLPCIGSSVQSIPEIVGDSGIVVAPDDPRLLADALIAILSDNDLGADLGRRARRRVERELTWDHVAARIMPTLEAW